MATRIKGRGIPFKEILVTLLGILSLLLLDLPFLRAQVLWYGNIDLASGLELAANGANPNLAEILTQRGFYSLSLPGRGFAFVPAVLSIWLILGGGLAAIAVGFSGILLGEKRYASAAGCTVFLAGLLVFTASLIAYYEIYMAVSLIEIPYVTVSSGLALTLELLLGLLIATLGLLELAKGLRGAESDAEYIPLYHTRRKS